MSATLFSAFLCPGKGKRRIAGALLLLAAATALSLSGCGSGEEAAKGGGREIAYTVVPTADCPADFLGEIQKKKGNPFQMTYDDGAFCYLAVGYGEQETNGFSIRVLGLREAGECIYFETSLIGPEKDQLVSRRASAPYLVVKMERTEKKVEFSI